MDEKVNVIIISLSTLFANCKPAAAIVATKEVSNGPKEVSNAPINATTTTR